MSALLSVQEIEDPTLRKAKFYDRLFLKLIRDPRDLPFIDLILKSTGLVLPMALWILSQEDISLWWVVAHYGIGGNLMGPFILMLHNTCHRPLFKRKYGYLNRYIPWVLGPFFGLTPETYYGHHVGMHHRENNLYDDLSCTMPYRRDSLIDFLKYFGRFFFFIPFELPIYFIKRNRYKLGTRVFLGEMLYYALVLALWVWNWKSTTFVFFLPFCITRFMMINGNWAQHAFVDPKNPEDNYKNSITCINSVYNRRCFNDGYHIVHHLFPTRHWREIPHHFRDQLKSYAEKDAVVFEKIDYFVIWIFLMLKRYNWLAKYFVDLRKEKRTREEIIALLKGRTRPAPFPAAG